MDYKPLYYYLFNAVTDAIEQLNRGEAFDAKLALMLAQREVEEMFLSCEEA